MHRRTTDLSYLADLGLTHSVISARIEVNPDLSGGVLIKFLLFNRVSVLVVVTPDADIELTTALRRFLRGRSLPQDDEGAAEFHARMPMIGPPDWDAITSDDNVVQVGTCATPTALGIEFTLASGDRLPILLAAGAAFRVEAALGAALPGRLKQPHVPIPPGHA